MSPEEIAAYTSGVFAPPGGTDAYFDDAPGLGDAAPQPSFSMAPAAAPGAARGAYVAAAPMSPEEVAAYTSGVFMPPQYAGGASAPAAPYVLRTHPAGVTPPPHRPVPYGSDPAASSPVPPAPAALPFLHGAAPAATGAGDDGAAFATWSPRGGALGGSVGPANVHRTPPAAAASPTDELDIVELPFSPPGPPPPKPKDPAAVAEEAAAAQAWALDMVEVGDDEDEDTGNASSTSTVDLGGGGGSGLSAPDGSSDEELALRPLGGTQAGSFRTLRLTGSGAGPHSTGAAYRSAAAVPRDLNGSPVTPDVPAGAARPTAASAAAAAAFPPHLREYLVADSPKLFRRHSALPPTAAAR